MQQIKNAFKTEFCYSLPQFLMFIKHKTHLSHMHQCSFVPDLGPPSIHTNIYSRSYLKNNQFSDYPCTKSKSVV